MYNALHMGIQEKQVAGNSPTCNIIEYSYRFTLSQNH
jgi:hypothetical protein